MSAPFPDSAQSLNSQISPYWLRLSDIRGSHTIPYIQSGRNLDIQIDFGALPPSATNACVELRCEGEKPRQRAATRTAPMAPFSELPAGEHSLTVTVKDEAGTQIRVVEYRDIGVGAVVAALGDSLTEGYNGHGFNRSSLDLAADDFPNDAVSADGRNFPQFSPTTAHHRPDVNCFQSWMTRLNDSLSKAWRQPVFLANEGFGGYTSANYLAMMRTNAGEWRDRMLRLCPTVWLIHLGVNDERHGMPRNEFAANMRAIVHCLLEDFSASPKSIYVARPSYDYAPGADAVLQEYIEEIKVLEEELGIRRGPDFFAAFSQDKEKWYGADSVHPGPEGMDRMADFWLESLAPNLPLPTHSDTPCLMMPATTEKI